MEEAIKKILEQKTPKEALKEIAEAVKKLFKLADEQDRMDFVVNMIGDAGKDNIAGMVHL